VRIREGGLFPRPLRVKDRKRAPLAGASPKRHRALLGGVPLNAKTVVTAFWLAIGTGAARAASPVDDLDRVLRTRVHIDGRVDYAGLRGADRAGLDRYLAWAATASVAGWSDARRSAFWINTYNARVLAVVADRPTLRSISDDFALFDAPFDAAAQRLSLNDIEHRILRGKSRQGQKPLPALGPAGFDPRIHFALVCGARDCPRLRSFAYTEDNLEKTLSENAFDFANAPRHLRLENGRLVVSSLLKWYGEDFEAVGGAPAYLSRLLAAAPRPDAADIRTRLKKGFAGADFRYDWSVNDADPR